MYTEVDIQPMWSGFGEWEARPMDLPVEDLAEDVELLEQAIEEALIDYPYGTLYKLGRDELPEEVEDIRGLIHNEPPHVYAIVFEEENLLVRYFGIEQVH